MDSIVTAGGLCKPDDPLYELTGIEKKALIPLSGRPMVAWVVDALWQSGLVEHIVVVGLEAGEVDFGDVPVNFTPSKGDMVDNALTALDALREVNPLTKKIIFSSSDIPLITPEIVRGFVEECGTQEADGYYAIIEEKTMEARFPGSKRTFVPFKDGRVAGGDLLLLDVAAAKANEQVIRGLTGSRKNYWQQAKLIGFGFIVRFIFRLMTVQDAAARARERVGIDAQVVETKYAELGMDLDKVHHYHLISSILEEREASA
jgi:GTP:adenosylcobinamide-phosphate guanylyltransferase